MKAWTLSARKAVAAGVVRYWRGETAPWTKALDVALWPAEQAFRAGVRARRVAYDQGWFTTHAAPLPVISIGNLAVGGAGKTPFAAWVADRLMDWGKHPVLLVSGYGRDEVLLHRELHPSVPVFAGPRRSVSARAAAAAGCNVAVLDDGFQHWALARDLDIVLVAAESWTPQRHLLPRGPWREGAEALGRAQIVVVTRKSADAEEAAEVRSDLVGGGNAARTAVAWIEPSELRALHGDTDDAMSLEVLAGQQVIAVTAVADPYAFAAHLSQAGAAVELAAFPDHHEFTADDIADLRPRAGTAPIVMTQKDAVKLRQLLSPAEPAYVLHQRVNIEEGGSELDRLLRAAAGIENR